jgi:hypothetical protein
VLCSVLFDPSSTRLQPALYSVLFDPSSTPALLLLRSKPLLRPRALLHPLRPELDVASSSSAQDRRQAAPQLSALYHARPAQPKSAQRDSRSGPEARAFCRSSPALRIRPTSCSRSGPTMLSRPRSGPAACSAWISCSGPDPHQAAPSPWRLLHPRWPRRGCRRLLGRCSRRWCPHRHCCGPAGLLFLTADTSAPAGLNVGFTEPLDAVAAVGAPTSTAAGTAGPWATATITGAPSGTAAGAFA